MVNNGSPLLLSLGTNTVTIVYADDATPAHSYTNSWQFATASGSGTAAYLALSQGNANSIVSASATNAGFIVYPWHTHASDPNDVAVWTEEQILGMRGTNYAVLTNWPNSQNQTTQNASLGPQGWFFVYTNYINWDIAGPNAQDWDFTSPSYPKQEYPGLITGNYPDESGFTASDGNNFAMLWRRGWGSPQPGSGKWASIAMTGSA